MKDGSRDFLLDHGLDLRLTVKASIGLQATWCIKADLHTAKG